jgi:hypothetical protein
MYKAHHPPIFRLRRDIKRIAATDRPKPIPVGSGTAVNGPAEADPPLAVGKTNPFWFPMFASMTVM